MKSVRWYREAGLRVPIWKINFCSRVLQLSVLPWCRERPQTAICCLQWLGRLKCLKPVEIHFCRLSLRYEFVLGIGCLVVSLFCRCITFCKECKLCSGWHWLLWFTCEMINDLDGSLGSRFVSCACPFKTEFRVDHLFGMHFWVKSYLCFCREMNGGCEKILPVSTSFWSNLKMIDFTTWLCEIGVAGSHFGAHGQTTVTYVYDRLRMKNSWVNEKQISQAE